MDGGAAVSVVYRSTTARLVRRSRRALAIAATPALLGLAAFLSAIFFASGKTSDVFVFMALPLGAFGIAGFGSAYVKQTDVELFGSELRVDGEALLVDGRALCKIADVEQAFVVPHEGETWVEIDRRGRPALFIKVDSDSDGRALLSALGFDATQAMATFRALPAFTTWSVGRQLLSTLAIAAALLIPLVAVLSGSKHPLVPFSALPFVLALSLTLLLFRSSKVTIGADGIRYKSLGNERFLPWSDITGVARWAAPTNSKPYVGLKVSLASGEQLSIGAGQEGWNAEAAEQLVLRAKQALEAYRTGARAAHVPALARGARDPLAWVRHLRAVGAGGSADARTSFTGPDALVRVLEDVTQPPLTRASAAVAAAAQLSPEELERVRIVAKTTVESPLRIAIDRALDEGSDEQALAEALLALEPSARSERT